MSNTLKVTVSREVPPKTFVPVKAEITVSSQEMLDKLAALVETPAFYTWLGSPAPTLAGELRSVGANPENYRAEIDDALA